MSWTIFNWRVSHDDTLWTLVDGEKERPLAAVARRAVGNGWIGTVANRRGELQSVSPRFSSLEAAVLWAEEQLTGKHPWSLNAEQISELGLIRKIRRLTG